MIEKLDSNIINLKIEESGWRIKRYETIFIEAFTTKVARGSSYIPTPVPFNNSRCGLVNIINHDLECFRWCMRYHQTKQSKNDDRISVLSKLSDKYDYSRYHNTSHFKPPRKTPHIHGVYFLKLRIYTEFIF